MENRINDIKLGDKIAMKNINIGEIVEVVLHEAGPVPFY